MLRNRDLNAQNTRDPTGFKSGAAKHKSVTDDEIGPPRPKRAAIGEITETLGSTVIDSSKKQGTAAPLKKEGRLLSLIEQEQSINLEVDPDQDFDYDKENATDPFAVSGFACDIFKYYQYREKLFVVEDYFGRQRKFDRKDRATAVDWLVKIQESFELNHETMYLAVKLMDMYISNTKQMLNKSILQLIPCAAVLIASKFEERSAPTIDDLLYMCRNQYKPSQLKRMEQEMLRIVGFDLGVPLSYSFLRRYGRVIKASMPLLTTARYYLEISLHYLKFCMMSESKLAAACMLLALRVTKSGDWNSILEKYSGYRLIDIEPLMFEVNHMIHRFPHENKACKTVIEKYSHQIFFEVALQELLVDRNKGPVEN